MAEGIKWVSDPDPASREDDLFSVCRVCEDRRSSCKPDGAIDEARRCSELQRPPNEADQEQREADDRDHACNSDSQWRNDLRGRRDTEEGEPHTCASRTDSEDGEQRDHERFPGTRMRPD